MLNDAFENNCFAIECLMFSCIGLKFVILSYYFKSANRDYSSPAPAASEMVIDKSCRLKEGVAYCSAKKFKPSLLHVTAHGIGHRCGNGNLRQRLEMIYHRHFMREECKDIVVETSEFTLDCHEQSRI